MGHQTNYVSCKKCGGVTITTRIGLSKREIKTSNCTCLKINENEKTSKANVRGRF